MLYIHDIGTCRVLMLVIVGRKKHTLFHIIFVFSYLCTLEMWFSADYVCVLQKINGISTCPKCIVVSISAWYLIIQLSSVLIIYTRCLDPPSPPPTVGVSLIALQTDQRNGLTNHGSGHWTLPFCWSWKGSVSPFSAFSPVLILESETQWPLVKLLLGEH